MPTPPRRPALPALTGARYVAALAVLLFHAVPPLFPGSNGAVVALVAKGHVGVSFFFVLSGFILAYTYLDPGAPLRGTHIAFWRARVARIYPVYLLALLVAAPMFFMVGFQHASLTQRHDSWLALALSPVLLQSWWSPAACRWNCPAWSLSAEAFFYAVFPVVGVWLASRRRTHLLPIAACVWTAAMLFPVAYVLALHSGAHSPAVMDFWKETLYYSPVVHLAEFVIGTVCGILFVGQPSEASLLPPWTTGAVITLLLALLIADVVPDMLLRDGILAPAFAIVILTLARGRGPAARFLALRPMVLLGESSYALYILHVPVLQYELAASKRFLDLNAHWPAGILITYALAVSVLSICVFRLIEEPARRALRTLSFRASYSTTPAEESAPAA